MTPRLELRNISKRYPGVVANDGISMAIAPGEIHAVLGENGAGKSTLMKIVYGMVRPDAGLVRLDGEALAASLWGRLQAGDVPAWLEPIPQAGPFSAYRIKPQS